MLKRKKQNRIGPCFFHASATASAGRLLLQTHSHQKHVIVALCFSHVSVSSSSTVAEIRVPRCACCGLVVWLAMLQLADPCLTRILTPWGRLCFPCGYINIRLLSISLIRLFLLPSPCPPPSLSPSPSHSFAPPLALSSSSCFFTFSSPSSASSSSSSSPPAPHSSPPPSSFASALASSSSSYADITHCFDFRVWIRTLNGVPRACA